MAGYAVGTTIIALEGTPGQAYEPRGWELWAPLAPLYAAGEYAEVADRLGALDAATPQYPGRGHLVDCWFARRPPTRP